MNCFRCNHPDAHPGTRRCVDLADCRVREVEAERDEALRDLSLIRVRLDEVTRVADEARAEVERLIVVPLVKP